MRNHITDCLACLNFTDFLVIPVDLDRSVIIMDEKGSLGANHAGVYMVVKLVTSFSLDSRSREGTQPGHLYGSYGSRACDPLSISRTTVRHLYLVAELQE